MRRKQLVFLFLIISGIGLGLPYLCSAYTDNIYAWIPFTTTWFSNLLETGSKPLAYAIQAVIFSIITGVSNLFLALSQELLRFVISPNFINIGFTHNDVVDAGLGITKNLGNIIIILSFIVIALATILKIREYEAQKTIPILILVALLINFSPVICGLIIDGSNIAMKYFLEETSLKESIAQKFIKQVEDLFTWNIPESQRFGMGIVFSVSNIVVCLVFFLFALLFIARYVALWILVIISPLAFACFILKFSRKYFTLWWNQFFQWSIIGIPAAFTLYLTNILIMMAEENRLTGAATGEHLTGFSIILQYLVPVAFLIGGFFMSLQTGAMGANIITGFFKKQVKGAGALAWKGTKWGARKISQKPMKKLGDWIGGTKEYEEKIKKLKEEGKGLGAGYYIRKIPGVRLLGRTISASISEADRKAINKKEKEARGTSLDNQAKMMESVNVLNRIAGLLAAMKDGNIKRLKDQGLLSNEKIKKIMEDAIKTYPTAMRDLRKISPKLAEEVGFTKGISRSTLKEAGIEFSREDVKKGWWTLSEKLFATAKPKDIEDIWDGETIDAYAKSRVSHLFATPNQIAAAVRAGGRAFINKYNEEGMKLAEKEGKKGLKGLKKFYKEHNKPLWSYRGSTAAQGLGIGFEAVGKEKISEEEIKKMKKTYQRQPWEKQKEEQEEKRKKKGGGRHAKGRKKGGDTGEEGAINRKESDVGEQ